MNSSTGSPPKIEQTGNVKIITFTGGKARDIENTLARELEGQTDALGECHLLLDFTNVEYLSSIELGTLISLNKKMKESGGRLTLFNLNAQVFEVFAVTRLQTLLGICREEPAIIPATLRAIAFDLDAASLSSLQEALPEWKIEVVKGATAASLGHDWSPGAADLLVVKALEDVAETLKLCRFLASCGIVSTAAGEEVAKTQGQPTDRQDQARRAGAPLLVLVPSKHGPFVKAALAAGADSCLVLPAHAKEMATMLARVRQGNQPGRHTLNLDRAQSEDSWRDDGGQG